MTMSGHQVGRRSLLLGSVGVGLSGCSIGGDVGGARAVNGVFGSKLMSGARIGWTLKYPPGHRLGDRLPVVISLHGRGASHRTTFTTLGLGEVLDEVVHAGTAPFALASVDGGEDNYWHRRSDGTDAGAMVAQEFVALLRDRGLDTSRLGLYGWSMGGYGALLLAGRHRVRPRGVAVSSPALFTSAGQTAVGAYDDAADYTRNDVFAHPGWLEGLPLHIDCGTSDPFYTATRDFVSRLHPHPAGGFGPGAHDVAYWRKVAPAQLRFLGRQLN
jgi:enterochelin esterase-like enzyme